MAENRAHALLESSKSRHGGGGSVPARRQAASAIAVAIASLALAGPLLWPPRPVLLWNATASSQIGLYAVRSFDHHHVGDRVVAWPPASARRLAAARRYLPANVPLVKRIAGISGDRVCARGETISVNGRPLAIRKSHDPSGRRLPWWSGCQMLRAGDVFLLTPHMPDAFDGRYFGVTRASEIIGEARLLWAVPAEGSSHG